MLPPSTLASGVASKTHRTALEPSSQPILSPWLGAKSRTVTEKRVKGIGNSLLDPFSSANRPVFCVTLAVSWASVPPPKVETTRQSTFPPRCELFQVLPVTEEVH